jgi:hypothetical protein
MIDGSPTQLLWLADLQRVEPPATLATGLGQLDEQGRGCLRGRSTEQMSRLVKEAG